MATRTPVRSILNPDDQSAQDRLHHEIVALRKAHFADEPAGAYARALGVASAALWTLEHPDRVSQTGRHGSGRVNLTIGSIERRCAPMAYTLVANLIDLPDVEDDPVVAVLAARRSDDPTKRAANLAALTAARLDTARLDLGLPAGVVAARIGVSRSCLSELNIIAGAGTRLATLQRFARALGGRLDPVLRPLTRPATHTEEPTP